MKPACRFALRTLGCALAAVPLLAAAASNYPDHPVTLVVPFVPGGGTDSIARDMAKTLSDKLGQPVIVDNRGGGGGSIGANLVAKAKNDGYTLLFATSTFATNAAAEPRLPYNPQKDFAPVGMIGRGPLLVVASKQMGVKNIKELIAAGKAKGAEGLNYCSAGIGSINHLSGELFHQKAGFPMTHVAYKGSGPATLDLIAGRVDVFFSTVPTILSFVKDDKVQVLAVTSAKRSPLFPDLPTLTEQGIPGFNITTWWGVLAPAGTAPAIIDKLNKAVNDAAAEEPVKGRLVTEGADAIRLTPAAFGVELNKELALWRGVVKNSNMQIR
ncbi:MAG: tripartite tricarboxylate transporter substrate binding protein [Pseudomonadota bacterium]